MQRVVTLLAMNIIKYAVNLIIAEVSQVEHVKLTILTNKTWRGSI